MIIEGVDFQQVHYGELDGRALLPSHAAEVEPLRVILRIRVCIQVEDILELSLPYGLLQVSTLELRVKEDDRVRVGHKKVIFLSVRLVAGKFRKSLVDPRLLLGASLQFNFGGQLFYPFT